MKFKDLVLLAEDNEGIEVERYYWDETNKTKPMFEYWYNKDGYRHRLDGPAIQGWDRNGNKVREEYFINGKELTPNEFKQLTKQYDKEDLDILNDLNT